MEIICQKITGQQVSPPYVKAKRPKEILSRFGRKGGRGSEYKIKNRKNAKGIGLGENLINYNEHLVHQD